MPYGKIKKAVKTIQTEQEHQERDSDFPWCNIYLNQKIQYIS